MRDHPTVEMVTEADIVSAIRAATHEVFFAMLNIEITSDEVIPRQPCREPFSGVISLIGMAGNWLGTASLVCSGDFARHLSSKLLMTEFEAVDDDVLDAMAEITNIIIGNVKNILEQKTGEMGLSLPTVIFGLNFQARTAQTSPWTVVRFTCPEGEMCVQMCLTPNRESLHTRPEIRFPQLLSM